MTADGSRALLIGSSGGIGSALRDALAARGTEVVGLSRRDHGLDVTDEASLAKHLGALEGSFELIFVATGALALPGSEPEKTLKALDPEQFLQQMALNALGPALVLKHARRLLPRDRPAIFAALSARVGSIGDNRLGGWYSYRASKAALNQMIRSASVEMARTHRQLVCVALHPGTVATPFTADYLGRHPAVPPEEAARNLLKVLDGLGPEHTGRFFDWAGKEVPW
ncbi:SDR family NAD(P)-dependent oxidoreductase [Alloyangia pacifica]|uniref:NAD(P)-dependent dehydrogenase, short-chain alcohol dehydrogenase family n=1 Tax=Alloyangia pacifica TaxID=311180 RepID=A0A1I6VBQ8_9RHOB|nr:SDR family NAD(P)-dependent oxidoreductase [Alloyangia pacifica]SDH85429.1 NAD(P)-dependent dehydrogenase, short-chain alcohol dehydrogenase family [Alloyangia pacifica]SFT10954.1 NAD(P)-dependent dehydrogenase, short-chain alcohol dehydrogenase family [Alloyangia pacifica]